MVKILTADELKKLNIDDYSIKEYAFVLLGEKLVNLGKKKPAINSDIYYDDERPRPDITYDFFKIYNMNTAFASFFNENCLKKNIYLIKHNMAWCELSHYRPFDEKTDLRALTDDEKTEILKAIETLKGNYEKRLKTYFKKYQSKIYAIGYWANR